MADWVKDGMTPHPTGGYVSSEHRWAGDRFFDVEGRLHRLDGPALRCPTFIEWRVHGQRHRFDGPAVEGSDGPSWWLFDVEYSKGDHSLLVSALTASRNGISAESWTQNGVTPHPTGGYVRAHWSRHHIRYWNAGGKLHRLDGPAIEYADGARSWYVDDKLHRLDGPAVELADGARHWYVNGKWHRLDGPALEHATGARRWYLSGVELTEAEHAAAVARLHETGEAP